MKRFLGVLVVILGVLVGGPAMAGGWAVSTLDSIPAPRAGQVVDVGFTIRQHGVTPANVDGEVGIVVRSGAGVEEFFPGQQVGPVGHYSAEVIFPQQGMVSWAVRQGWFAEQDLGQIEVAPPRNGVVDQNRYAWPYLIRVGLIVMAVGLALLALVDFATDRRRRPVVV